MTDVTPPKKGISEYTLIFSAVLWALTQVGLFLTTHTSLIDSAHWTTLTNFLAPIVTTAVIGAFAFLLRHFVSPAWKVVQGDLNKAGLHVSDAEIEALAEQLFLSFQVKQATAEATSSNAALAEAAPDEQATLAAQVPMHAGYVAENPNPEAPLIPAPQV